MILGYVKIMNCFKSKRLESSISIEEVAKTLKNDAQSAEAKAEVAKE